MSYNPDFDHGFAEQISWVEIDPATLSAEQFTNPNPEISGSARRFAHVVHQINPAPVSLSAQNVNVNMTVLENEVEAISADVDAIRNNIALGIVDRALAVRIEEIGSNTFFAESEPGSPLTAAVWRAKQISELGGGITQITWADGDGNFDNTADELSALTYF